MWYYNSRMHSLIVSKILFTVTFPPRNGLRTHVPAPKLHSLAKKQLSDGEIIETIDHLFKCQRCFENYRMIRTSYLPTL